MTTEDAIRIARGMTISKLEALAVALLTERDALKARVRELEAERDDADNAIDCRQRPDCLTPSDPCWEHWQRAAEARERALREALTHVRREVGTAIGDTRDYEGTISRLDWWFRQRESQPAEGGER